MIQPLPDQVRALISEWLCVEPEKCTDDAKLADDLGADSLDRIELAMAAEEKFRLRDMPDADVEKLVTVGDVIALIERLKGAASG